MNRALQAILALADNNPDQIDELIDQLYSDELTDAEMITLKDEGISFEIRRQRALLAAEHATYLLSQVKASLPTGPDAVRIAEAADVMILQLLGTTEYERARAARDGQPTADFDTAISQLHAKHVAIRALFA